MALPRGRNPSPEAPAAAERERSRSLLDRLLGRPGAAPPAQVPGEAPQPVAGRPEEQMHAYATTIHSAGKTEQTHLRELIAGMQIADFEKYKMVTSFSCPRGKVAEKMRTELQAKRFPAEAIAAVVTGLAGLSRYRKIDDDFEHMKNGVSKLYKYAVWCDSDSDDHMDVSMMCIATTFKKGKKGCATKNEIEGLKRFLEQETCSDVLQINDGCVRELTPEKSMVAYAKRVQGASEQSGLHEDELINRMEIAAFEKYKMVAAFRCPQAQVVEKIRSELEVKKFPEVVVKAVIANMDELRSYKKTDETFHVCGKDGWSNLYKYAIWCNTDNEAQMDVSIMCIAASFKKSSNGPSTKSEIEVMRSYLEQETCTDVLQIATV